MAKKMTPQPPCHSGKYHNSYSHRYESQAPCSHSQPAEDCPACPGLTGPAGILPAQAWQLTGQDLGLELWNKRRKVEHGGTAC